MLERSWKSMNPSVAAAGGGGAKPANAGGTDLSGEVVRGRGGLGKCVNGLKVLSGWTSTSLQVRPVCCGGGLRPLAVAAWLWLCVCGGGPPPLAVAAWLWICVCGCDLWPFGVAA